MNSNQVVMRTLFTMGWFFVIALYLLIVLMSAIGQECEERYTKFVDWYQDTACEIDQRLE